ncbi:MAG: LysR family transcriptional regulator [Rudaea sp.]|uniref:LysR family transcriptional regulator n=1 Tax=Rudaea sp. TaxID=2136325 RepID=UPI0039E56EE6
MRYQKLDLNLLSALKVLLEKRNVTRAGELLHVSQSAMSGILARLRDYFEDPLIVQVGRRMELTPLAESLLEPVTDILVRIDTTIHSRPELDPASMRRHFTFVASDYVSAVLLCDVLREVHKEAPGISWKFRQPSAQTASQLDSGDVDFIICPDEHASSTQSRTVLFEDSYVIAVDRDNAEIGDTISLDQYMAAGHVSFQAGNDGVPMFESWFIDRYGEHARRIEVSVNSFHLLPYLIAGTNRVATLHVRMADSYLRNLPLRPVKPLFEMPHLTEVLQWHRHRDLDPGTQWLRQKIIAMAQKMPAIDSLYPSLLPSAGESTAVVPMKRARKQARG